MMVAGDTANCPGSAPVPVSATERFGFEAVDAIARLPVTLPADCGANETVNATL